MLIQVALNGGRSRTEHPAIPITPDELAASAKESVAAGAGSIHFHVRAANGRESLDPGDVGNALTAIRSAVPGTPVGVSTGAWILRNTALRHETVSRWKVLPDFASVNFQEDGAVPLAELLLARGIAVEAGLSDLQSTETFVQSGLAPTCLRLLLESFEKTSVAALEVLEDILRVTHQGRVRLPVLLHGVNQTTWELIDEAAHRGYDTRIGFEDILTLPNGNSAPDNAALVAEAARRLSKSHPG
jgi:uncharacterized protein (DUF849 family)